MAPQQDFLWNKVTSYSEKGGELSCAFLQPSPNSSTIALGENDPFLHKAPFLRQTELQQACSTARGIWLSLSIFQALTALWKAE